MKAISLFSGAGIGEFYLHNQGIDIVLANEIISKRAETHSLFYPSCEMINADIRDEQVQKKIVGQGKKLGIRMVIATPPCQGLSSAGSNKTETSLYGDPRNYLILSALNIVDGILPDYFLIENVPRFQQMVFLYKGESVKLFELLQLKYNDKYEISVDVLNAADYGVPQIRYRVVYRMWRKGLTWTLPGKEKTVTLLDAIGDLPSLEAGDVSGIKNHTARQHTKNHIDCMRNTPTGKSAFSNEDHYPKKADGSRITGYGNSYKRMRWDAPAPTITMRNEIISSQENVHPGRQLPDGTWSDARVLTLRELLIISSLPPDLDKPPFLTETAFRQIIGEGIPPLMLAKIMGGITDKS
ncbi:MAG: DNA cytosine methyltransferase [Lactococcus chungangensis]|nr:DNA cytosine methyltransferase [Lactococcus chungangensis]